MRRSQGILERTGAQDGDLDLLRRRHGQGRQRCARRAAAEGRPGPEARGETGWQPLWVVDFPMFEWDADGKRWAAMHHPFTSPRDPMTRGAARRSGKRARQGLRHGAQRLGDRRRLGAYPSPGDAVDGVRAARHRRRRRRSAKFGFLLDALQVRRAAAWRHRVRPRPPRRC